MAFKIPIPAFIQVSALDYLVNSKNYTHQYGSQWGQERLNTAQCILTGQIGQRALFHFLKINGYDVVCDETPFWETDKTDFIFNGFSVDVKSTTTSWPMQVTYEKSRGETDFFAHVRVDIELQWIELFGFVSVSDVMQPEYLIHRGELIPGTNAKQRMEKSYFYTGRYFSITKMPRKRTARIA